jgi:uncharacterized membrane protein
VAIGALAALVLIILLPGAKWASNALRIFYAICFVLLGYFGIVRPAMRKTVAESGEQYLYPFQIRAFAWSATFGLILAPVAGLLVGLGVAVALFISQPPL